MHTVQQATEQNNVPVPTTDDHHHGRTKSNTVAAGRGWWHDEINARPLSRGSPTMQRASILLAPFYAYTAKASSTHNILENSTRTHIIMTQRTEKATAAGKK